jgi:hypothetical protein
MKNIQKLNVRRVTDIILEEENGNVVNFTSLYSFDSFLGTGSYGFVVKAQ